MNFNISKLVFFPFPHLPQLATLRLRGRAGPDGFKVHFGTPCLPFPQLLYPCSTSSPWSSRFSMIPPGYWKRPKGN